MSIFKRIKAIIKSGSDDLFRKDEAPEVVLDRVIAQMKSELKSAKLDVAAAIRDQMRLERQVKDQQKIVDKYMARARSLIECGDDELAKQVLREKVAAQGILRDLEANLDSQREIVNKLRLGLSELEAGINRAERRKVLLIARMKRAEVARKVARTLAGFSPDDASGLLEQIEKEVIDIESEVQGIQELENSSLEKSFQKLQKEDDVEREFAEIKSELGR